MKVVLAALFLTSLSAQAVFQDIWKGYKTSTVAELRNIETDAVSNALDVSLSQNAWRFDLTGDFQDAYLDALFSFNAQRTISQSVSAKLSRPTFNYGTFSYELIGTHYDLSKWTTQLFSTTPMADRLYEVRNALTYSYEIIGRTQPLKEELAEAKFGAEDAENNLEREREHLELYQAYLAAKLEVYRARLAMEFKDRAQRLKSAIYKRYKDGLSREAEYLQAKNAELSQEQELEKALAALKERLAVIENILGREIPKSYFDLLEWEFRPFAEWKPNIKDRANKEMLALEARIRLVDKDLESFENSRSSKLVLNAYYTSNAFNQSLDSAYYKGDIITPTHDTKQVTLVYSVPFGQDFNRSEREKLFIDKKRSELRKQRLQDELEIKNKVYKAQIARYEKAFDIGKRQVEVASRRVDEQSKLYLRGLGTFDETIRAEEELLNAKSALYVTLYQYDLTLGNYAFLRGSISTLLDAYTD